MRKKILGTVLSATMVLSMLPMSLNADTLNPDVYLVPGETEKFMGNFYYKTGNGSPYSPSGTIYLTEDGTADSIREIEYNQSQSNEYYELGNIFNKLTFTLIGNENTDKFSFASASIQEYSGVASLSLDLFDAEGREYKSVLTYNLYKYLIEDVNLSDVVVPIGGDKPVCDVTTEEGYTVRDNMFSFEWYDSEGKKLTSDDEFEMGEEYTVEITLDPVEDYAFADEITAKVNGEEVDEVFSAAIGIQLVYTFPEIEPIIYNITEGDKAEWINKDEASSLTFISDADFAKFTKVVIDETEADSENYAVDADNSSVELAPEYLAGLSEGEHTITIWTKSGKATASFTVTVPEPEITKEPEVTVAPEVTGEPEITGAPEVTKEPEVTSEPEVTKEPVVTAAPVVTSEPTVTVAPTSEVVPSAAPTSEAVPTAVPTAEPTAEPTASAEGEARIDDFVSRCYTVALSRDAENEGLNYWMEKLLNGEACGAQVGYGFIFSAEYESRNRTDEEFIGDLYSMYFGREPDAAGFDYWMERITSGMTREEIFAGFVNSNEFYNLCSDFGVTAGYYAVGVDLEAQGGVNCFVSRMYDVCFGRLPDLDGQQAWASQLIGQGVTGTSCAFGFIFSEEFINAGLSNEEFVKCMYKAFFGREADDEGLNYWTEQLNNGTSAREDIFNGFSNSTEFDNLCTSFSIVR